MPLTVAALLAGLSGGAALARDPGFRTETGARDFFSLTSSRARLDSTAAPAAPGLRLNGSADAGYDPSGQAAFRTRVHGLRPRPGITAEASVANGPSYGALLLRHTTDPAAPLLHRPVNDALSVSLNGGYQFGANWGLMASVGSARAGLAGRSGDAQPGLVARTDFVSVGVLRRENWLPGDRIALSLGQPRHHLGTTGGAVFDPGIDVGTGARDRLSLRPSQRELLTEIEYFAPLTRDTGLGLSLANRSRLATESGTQDERIMSIRFSTRF